MAKAFYCALPSWTTFLAVIKLKHGMRGALDDDTTDVEALLLINPYDVGKHQAIIRGSEDTLTYR